MRETQEIDIFARLREQMAKIVLYRKQLQKLWEKHFGYDNWDFVPPDVVEQAYTAVVACKSTLRDLYPMLQEYLPHVGQVEKMRANISVKEAMDSNAAAIALRVYLPMCETLSETALHKKSNVSQFLEAFVQHLDKVLTALGNCIPSEEEQLACQRSPLAQSGESDENRIQRLLATGTAQECLTEATHWLEHYLDREDGELEPISTALALHERLAVLLAQTAHAASGQP